MANYVRSKIRKNAKDGSSVTRARACEAKLLKQAAELADLLVDSDATGAIKTLRDGLSATKKTWDGNARDWVEQPDWKTRHDCAMAILAYRFGKPIERQVQVTAKYEELPEIIARIRASPMAMKKLGHLVPRHELDSLRIGPSVTSEGKPTQGNDLENKPTPSVEL
jgi:hypothetical protein